jgi:hypothetical protein
MQPVGRTSATGTLFVARGVTTPPGLVATPTGAPAAVRAMPSTCILARLPVVTGAGPCEHAGCPNKSARFRNGTERLRW